MSRITALILCGVGIVLFIACRHCLKLANKNCKSYATGRGCNEGDCVCPGVQWLAGKGVCFGFIGFVVFGLGFFSFIFGPDKWQALNEGVFEEATYIQGSFSQPPKTIIKFSDGRTVILEGHHNVDVYKGDNVQILQLNNNNRGIRFEKR